MTKITVQAVRNETERDNVQLLVTIPGIRIASMRTNGAALLADLRAALQLAFGDDSVEVID